jgi:hypothetical protein
MNDSLRIGAPLPADYVTSTTAILAQRRKGKTYTASVIAEELCRLVRPWVALDPTGAWWGLRAGRSPSARGLPVVILGGAHGDVPLEDTAGRVIAELVVEWPGYYVLDLSGFGTRASEVRFARDFADRLYRLKQKDRDHPLHVFVDEAELFVPQRVGPEETKMLGAFESIVKRGGILGLGTTLISQRAAAVNKNVLEQVDRLILLRTVGPNDRRAVDEYVKAFATPEQREQVMGSLASLELGEAWVYEPGDGVLSRIHVRERRTFNSSATPTGGAMAVEPKLSPVDLAALTERMAATIEKAEADDPKRLRAKLAAAERLIERMQKEAPPLPPPPPEPVVVHVWPDGEVADLAEEVRQLGLRMDAMLAKVPNPKLTVPVRVETASMPYRGADETLPPLPRLAAVPDQPRDRKIESSDHLDGKLPKAQRLILSVLAQHKDGRTKRQLALQTGYAVGGGGFANALGALRSADLVHRGDPIRITEKGYLAIDGQYEELPTGPELLEFWSGRLGKAERLILQALVTAYPVALSKEELADATGYTASGGGFANALGKLRTLELIYRGSPIALDDSFARAVQG